MSGMAAVDLLSFFSTIFLCRWQKHSCSWLLRVESWFTTRAARSPSSLPQRTKSGWPDAIAHLAGVQSPPQEWADGGTDIADIFDGMPEIE